MAKQKPRALTAEHVSALRSGDTSFRTVAKQLGVSHVTVRRRFEKFKDKVRDADEFKNLVALEAPRRETQSYSWSLETIRSARDAQLRGDFKEAVRLSEAMRVDDALFVARRNRISPQDAILAVLTPASGFRGKAVAKKAATSVIVSRAVLKGIHATLVDHGIAIGYNEQVVNADGTRIDFKLTEWPLEAVKWNTSTEQLEARVRGGGMVPIVHGDGRWTVFRNFEERPWAQVACVLPAALVWASHANGVRDWAQASTSHGQAKMIGELPVGVPLGTAEQLTSEAAAFLRVLQQVMSGEAGVGLRPAGSKTEFIANGSTAWQVFLELITNREKAAARIYLGTDAILGSQGGAPGVDISALFQIAGTILQGDFEAIEQGLRTGVYEPWAAMNEGSSLHAPWLLYQLPDTDSLRKSDEHAKKHTNFMTAIKERKEQGFVVDQQVVNELAALHGISPAPKLAAAGAAKVSLTLAPTSLDVIVRGDEGRSSQGLPAFGDERGNKTIYQLKAEADAAGAVKEAAGTAKVEGTTSPPAP